MLYSMNDPYQAVHLYDWDLDNTISVQLVDSNIAGQRLQCLFYRIQ